MVLCSPVYKYIRVSTACHRKKRGLKSRWNSEDTIQTALVCTSMQSHEACFYNKGDNLHHSSDVIKCAVSGHLDLNKLNVLQY